MLLYDDCNWQTVCCHQARPKPGLSHLILQNIRRKQAAQRKRIRKRQDESAARQSARTAEEQVQHELFGEQADAGQLKRDIASNCQHVDICSAWPDLLYACMHHGAPCLFVACMTYLTVTSCTGIEDEQDDGLPQHQTQMRYDEEGIDSEDDFIDDDLGEGIQGQQPRRARGKGRTAGVHSQAVQVCHTLLQCMPCQYRHDNNHCPQQCTSSFVKVTHNA